MRSETTTRRRLITWAGALALLGAAWLVAPAEAAAQPQGNPPAGGEGAAGDEEGKDKKKDDAPKVKVERGAGGKKVYVIKTGFVIEGRIQKPNAFYVLQRSQINYDWAALKQQFVPRILEAVNKSPF
jgi:hypothetical protein